MYKIHACLLGKWVCLNDDIDCKIGDGEILLPIKEWCENSIIHAPLKRSKENHFAHLDYVEIIYQGIRYSISPIFLQTTEQP